ncbi:MAG: type II toxin-antitoxin system HicA family toxin [Desulfuromonas sp.]|nr:type II toxin-antitoxin system HicA family toxin [Desulfuromonas sp.]
MSSRNPPLEYREVAKGLRKLGFALQLKGSTGHEHWKKEERGRLYKVTVSKHNAPFGPDIIKSMAAQAGVKKRVFYKACGKG